MFCSVGEYHQNCTLYNQHLGTMYGIALLGLFGLNGPYWALIDPLASHERKGALFINHILLLHFLHKGEWFVCAWFL